MSFNFGTPSSNLLGATTTSSNSLWGGFGSTQSTSNTLAGGLGTTQQQQNQPNNSNISNDVAALVASCTSPSVFGDDRDVLLAKWNQLQAFWGVGSGYYTQQGNMVQYTQNNPLCRFKAVGYSFKPSSTAQDGLVALIINKPLKDVQSQQEAVVESLAKMLGSKPGVTICVDAVRSLPGDKTELVMFAQERQMTGATRRASANDLYQALIQQNIRSQLQSNLAVVNVVPKTGLSDDQLKSYLDNPPVGIDQRLWQQARLDNPDPDKLIPMPMIGFTELSDRMGHQNAQTALHQQRLKIIDGDISELQRAMAATQAKLEQYKRRQLDLGHRVLQVMVKQEIHRKQGFAIQADEEQLRVQLEALQASLNAPMQFKGRLNELMSQLRMQNQMVGAAQGDVRTTADAQTLSAVRQHLKQQQDGIQHLLGVIKDDLEDMKVIEQAMTANKSPVKGT